MNKFIITFVTVLSLLISYESSFAFGTPVKVSTMKDVYATGNNIAQGLAEGFVIGLGLIENKTNYNITHKNDKYKKDSNEWPIVKTIIKINNKDEIIILTFLELNGNITVGTVNGVLHNKKVINSPLTNTMYVETDEGIEQVTIKNGKLVFIE